MTARLKQSTGISASGIHLSAALSRSRSTNIRAQSTYMTASTLQRAAEPYRSHGDLVNPDHMLLLMYLCTDHVRQSGSWMIISTSSRLYSTRVCGTNSESSSQLHTCVCCDRLSQKNNSVVIYVKSVLCCCTSKRSLVVGEDRRVYLDV